MTRLAQRASPRAGAPIQHRVALTAGAEALQEQVQTHGPQHTLVLDIIHATEDRWDTANALLGDTHPHRLAGVRAYLEPLLAGQTDAVITALEAEGKDPTCTMHSCPLKRTSPEARLRGLTPRLPHALLTRWRSVGSSRHEGRERREWP